MSKDEFLRMLDRKLQIINENERRDIIDEYRMHIEMKVKEGITEEEAIEDFGDIDELVHDILDAYKINTSNTQSFDAKFNHFMDELGDSCKRLLSSFTSLDVDEVIRLIFDAIIILILLFILKIPFAILSSLGAALLRSVIGFGIGSGLAVVWEVVINLAYVAIFILIFISAISKRVDRYRSLHHDDHTVFDDFKESVQDVTSRNSKKRETIYDEKDDCSYDESGRYKKTDAAYYTSSIVSVIMKVIFCLLMIPVIGIIVGLSCALGAMVILSLEGITLVGAYLIVIGALMITSAFLSAFYHVLWRK